MTASEINELADKFESMAIADLRDIFDADVPKGFISAIETRSLGRFKIASELRRASRRYRTYADMGFGEIAAETPQ